VHARGCGNGAPRAGSIIVDHEGAPCTDSRYHRHCRALDCGEPDGWRTPRAGPQPAVVLALTIHLPAIVLLCSLRWCPRPQQ
jgi:hypothetical protein